MLKCKHAHELQTGELHGSTVCHAQACVVMDNDVQADLLVGRSVSITPGKASDSLHFVCSRCSLNGPLVHIRGGKLE